MASTNTPKPKPRTQPGDIQKITEANEKTAAAVEEALNPENALVATNLEEITTAVTTGERKVDIFVHRDVLEELSKVTKELEFAKGQLNEIRLILGNPFHQVGYLVNAQPIQTIVDRKYHAD